MSLKKLISARLENMARGDFLDLFSFSDLVLIAIFERDKKIKKNLIHVYICFGFRSIYINNWIDDYIIIGI